MLIIYLLLYQTAFLLGFVIGRRYNTHSNNAEEHSALLSSSILHHIQSRLPLSSTSLDIDQLDKPIAPSPRPKNKAVKIDDSTFVTIVKSDILEKKGANLGTQTIVNDNVETSVSRLAQLKKNK